VVALVVFLLFPLVSSLTTRSQVSRSGVDVVARVVGTSDAERSVGYVLPEDSDPEQRVWTAELESAAYAEAVRTRRVQVRVVEGRPEAHRVTGQVDDPTGLIVTLVSAAAVLGVGMLWVLRGRRRPTLRLHADGPLAPAEVDPAGGSVTPLPGDRYEVVGVVVSISTDPAEVVLSVPERQVVVALGDHPNPVEVGGTARARGVLVG